MNKAALRLGMHTSVRLLLKRSCREKREKLSAHDGHCRAHRPTPSAAWHLHRRCSVRGAQWSTARHPRAAIDTTPAGINCWQLQLPLRCPTPTTSKPYARWRPSSQRKGSKANNNQRFHYASVSHLGGCPKFAQWGVDSTSEGGPTAAGMARSQVPGGSRRACWLLPCAVSRYSSACGETCLCCA